MATEYKETQAPEGDTRGEVLDQLCGFNPWVLVIAALDEDGGMTLKIEMGGKISEARTIRNLLKKTLAALPEGD